MQDQAPDNRNRDRLRDIHNHTITAKMMNKNLPEDSLGTLSPLPIGKGVESDFENVEHAGSYRWLNIPLKKKKKDIGREGRRTIRRSREECERDEEDQERERDERKFIRLGIPGTRVYTLDVDDLELIKKRSLTCWINLSLGK